MSNLMRSNLRRLMKHPVLWVCCAIQIVIAVIQGFTSWSTVDQKPLDSLFTGTISMGSMPITPWLILLMGAIILGDDIKPRTINNKLILGYSRNDVFISGFLTVLVGAFIMYAVRLLALCLFGLPLLAIGGYFSYRWQYIVAALFDWIFVMTFYSAMAAFLASMATNTVGILWRIIVIYAVVFVFAFLGYFQMNYFEQEYLDFAVQSIIKDYPPIEITKETPSKIARDFNKFLFDYLPFGQCMQISWGNPLCLLQTIPYTIINTVLALGGGLLITNKRNFS